jgi:hypothetical protein
LELGHFGNSSVGKETLMRSLIFVDLMAGNWLLLRNLQSDSVDHPEVLAILTYERKTAFDGCCSEQRVKGPQTYDFA